MMYVVLLLGSLALAFVARHRFYPRLYAGIPYNKHSANRLTGDIPDLTPIIKATNEYSSALLAVTTERLRRPLAQLLFPALRPPLLILDDPREIEDVLVRRGREFDRAPVSMHILRHYFRNAMMTQFNTAPGLRDQKRVWADAFDADFLRRVAAPSIYQATLELLELWHLKATSRPFRVLEDFHNATFDAMWVALTGEKAGLIHHEIEKLQHEQSQSAASGVGGRKHLIGPSPHEHVIKKEVEYVNGMISKGFGSIGLSRLAQMVSAYLPRHRQFRRTVDTEVGLVIRKAVDRFQRLETDYSEAGEGDTCMMDMVLRRKVAEARKSGQPLMDPTKDKFLIDDTFMMILAGYDTTADALTWFVRYMESYPEAQTKLRAVLKAAFPDTKTPSMEEILGTDIPYLGAVCEETFRLGGVAKGNLRSTTVDTHIFGHFVPKGTELFMNFHVDHAPYPVDEEDRSASSQAAGKKLTVGKGASHYKAVAIRDLGSFEPRRWLVTDEKTDKEVFDAQALPQLAFGGGYRGCSGRKLAAMEFRTVAALLVLNFELLELPEAMKTLKTHEKMLRLPDMPFASLRAL
ncbi:Cytochrome P450 [Apiospora saccharicola]